MKTFVITLILIIAILAEAIVMTYLHAGLGLGLLFGIVDTFLFVYLRERYED